MDEEDREMDFCSQCGAGYYGFHACEMFQEPEMPLTYENKRSLAYNLAIAEKLRQRPDEILAKAHHNLAFMEQVHGSSNPLFECWREWLALPLEELTTLMLDEGYHAIEMRKASPFSGILTAEERREIIEKLRQEASYPSFPNCS